MQLPPAKSANSISHLFALSADTIPLYILYVLVSAIMQANLAGGSEKGSARLRAPAYFLRDALAVRLLQFSSLPSYKYNKTLLTLRPEGVTKSRNLIARTVARRAPATRRRSGV